MIRTTHGWSLEEINQDLLLEARENLFNEQCNQQMVAAIKVSFLPSFLFCLSHHIIFFPNAIPISYPLTQ
jgi:hypothetical protein